MPCEKSCSIDHSKKIKRKNQCEACGTLDPVGPKGECGVCGWIEDKKNVTTDKKTKI